MSPQTKRLFLWFVVSFLVLFIILISISLLHNFNKPRLISLPSRELRGVWMSRFDYTQPFETHDADSIKAYISDSFRKFREANFNVVFLQIRGNGDAFYHSRHEPWSSFLTGQLGKDPGWDPLAFAIETAHQNNLELHAWLNTFPIWRGTTPPPVTQPLHTYLAHPEWLICDLDGEPMPLSDHYVSISPGIPEVQEYIVKIANDIVSNYDVDGIHFDYVRYPEGSAAHGYSHDKVSVARFQSHESNPHKLDWDDWQREQLTAFIAKIYNSITALKPQVTVSTALIGSYAAAPWNGYFSVYQDGRRWAELGKVDILIPMAYYGHDQNEYTYPEALKEWKAIVSTERPLYPGIGAFNLEWSEVIEEIHDTRNNHFRGSVIFAASSLDEEKLSSLRTTEFKFLAIPPAMTWKDTIPPAAPTDFRIRKNNPNDAEFTWQMSATPLDGDACRYYIIYRSLDQPVDLTKGENIFAIGSR